MDKNQNSDLKELLEQISERIRVLEERVKTVEDVLYSGIVFVPDFHSGETN